MVANTGGGEAVKGPVLPGQPRGVRFEDADNDGPLDVEARALPEPDYPVPDEADGGYKIRSHKREGPKRWLRTEMYDVQLALRVSRRGSSTVSQLLKLLRPAGRKAAIKYDDLLVAQDLLDVRDYYRSQGVTGLDEEKRIIWANNTGYLLYANTTEGGESGAAPAVDADGAVGTEYDRRRRVYGMEVVKRLVAEGVFDEGAERGFDHLLEVLEKYDALLETREELREELANQRLHKLRTFGATALKWTIGLPVTLLNGLFVRLYVYTAAIGREVISSMEVYRGRRFAAVATVGAFAFAAYFALYKQHKLGLPFSSNHNELAVGPSGGNSHGSVPLVTEQASASAPGSTAPNPNNIPNVPTPNGEGHTQMVPPSGGGSGGNIVQFADPGAYQTAAGEGWIHQFHQMGLTYDKSFMDNGTGAWLERMGYAYQHFDPSSGSYEWRMNYTNISPSVLSELFTRATKAGLAGH